MEIITINQELVESINIEPESDRDLVFVGRQWTVAIAFDEYMSSVKH